MLSTESSIHLVNKEGRVTGSRRRCGTRSALLTTPLGVIGIDWHGEELVGVDLMPDPYQNPGTDLPAAVRHQFAGYFTDGAFRFTLPLGLRGSAFQQRVWAALQLIPPGQTLTYGELARELGSAPRAIGQACRTNPCPIVVPCHRVVARQGLGGFAGDTSGRQLAFKQWLLRHEGAPVAQVL